MSKADDVFMRQFGIVIVCLVAFFFFAVFLARAIADVSEEARFQSEKEALERIRPVGEVRVAGTAPADSDAAPAPAAAAGTAASETAAGEGAAGVDGAAVYGQACAACHSSGVLESPKIGDTAAWEPRAAKGMATLLDHAVNGFNAMPARGGMATLSDEEVQAAISHMLSESGVSAQ